ncbi:hypothetical protein ACPEH7_01990 [Stenotrophomonas sp. NPDC101269]|uniref:hypothetical protein n=1 Tax=Stenotrophomonas sp. NPDC101269 TaxID=3415003 RepID=UPI003C2FA001
MSAPSTIPAIRHAVSALHGAADDGADTRRYADALQETGAALGELVDHLQAVFDAERDGFRVRLWYYNRAGVTVYPAGCDDRVQKVRDALARVKGRAA